VLRQADLERAGSERRRVAFGVALELDGVDVPSLEPGVSDPAAATPVTTVRLVPAGEIAERWAAARPQRARELRGRDGRVLLTVDFDPEHGYLFTREVPRP
jgi:hypothetical protein